MILPQEAPQDAAYMELNDLDIPLNHPAETIGTGQLVPGYFCTPYNSNNGMQQLCFGSNSLGIVQDFGEHHLPALPESYTQQVNHPDMVRPCSSFLSGMELIFSLVSHIFTN